MARPQTDPLPSGAAALGPPVVALMAGHTGEHALHKVDNPVAEGLTVCYDNLHVWVVLGTVATPVGLAAAAPSQPEGQLVIAFDTTIAPSYLDPAETTGLAAPFGFLYAL